MNSALFRLCVGCVATAVVALAPVAAAVPAMAAGAAQTGPVSDAGRLPALQREVLLTEMPILVAPRPGSTSVVVSLIVKVGSTFDRAGKAGLARLTAESLLAGAGGYDAKRIQLELEDAEGRLDVQVDWDSTRLTILGPARNVATFLDLLGRLVTLPDLASKRFTDEQFAPYKRARLDAAVKAQSPEAAADALFFKTLYGGHPYHHAVDGTPETIQSISRFDAADFWRRHYMPNNAALVVVGDATLPQIISPARRAFGGWTKAKPAPPTFLPPAEIVGTRIVLNPDPKLPKAHIRAGFLTTRFSDAERLSWLVVDEALKRRLSPEAVVVETRALPDGPWMLRAAAAPEKIGAAVAQLTAELARLRDNGLAPQELQEAKDALMKRYHDAATGNAGVAEILGTLERHGVGQRADAEFLQRLARLSADDLKPTLARLGGKSLLIVVQGGAADEREALSKFGAVEIAAAPGAAKP